MYPYLLLREFFIIQIHSSDRHVSHGCFLLVFFIVLCGGTLLDSTFLSLRLIKNGSSHDYIQVFIILHVVALVYYIKGILTPQMFKVAVTLVIAVGL